jgi:hypothetical protein
VPGSPEAASPIETPVVPEQTSEPETTTVEQVSETVPEQVVSAETAPEQVSDEVSDVIEFLEFAKSNPKAKFRIPNKNAKEGFVELDAEKAAAILGQGSAIHEEQRAFKVREAEFNEYEQSRKNQLDNLALAMEFTVEPKLQTAYEEIRKTQEYNNIFQSQLEQTSDYVEQERIRANIAQNERYIEQQGDLIRTTRPQVEQFRQYRQEQVKHIVDNSRKSFKDRDLKNEYVFNELRDKLSKDWTVANNEFIPGVKNLDLITSDEHILSLLRDGMKFREGVKTTNSGGSLAAATQSMKRAATPPKNAQVELQQRASKGDKNATRDLLSSYLSQQRAVRKAS